MLLRIYTYKITFEEIPHWYWGVHKERKYNDGYMGSAVTHRWMWEFYTPRIQILEVFPFTEEGWKEAQQVEKRLIRADLNNPLCLNEGCGSVISIESSSRGGKITGPKNKGRVHTEEAIRNFRAGHAKPESKTKRSRASKEMMQRPEIIEAIRKKALDRWAARKEELSASMRGVKVGYKWWVNEKGTLRHCPEPPGPEWQHGRQWRTP